MKFLQYRFNKAARENENASKYAWGKVVEDAWLGTFHSDLLKAVRRHAEIVGLEMNFIHVWI